MQRSSILAQHFLSTCQNFSFTRGLGYEAFWGTDLSRYKYFWLPPQNIFEFDYLEDLISHLPIKFISSSFPSYHKCFYLEYGPSEYDLAPSHLMVLSFTKNSNPIDSPTFFMLMVKPPPKKIPYSFFTPSFHYQFYPNDELEEVSEVEEIDSSSWRARLAMLTHPHEEEEIDYIFPWRYDHGKSTMSPEIIQRFRSKHVFWDAPSSYIMDKQPLRLTWKLWQTYLL